MNILCNYFEFEPVVLDEMPFKEISYLDIWQQSCSAECNHLCNFGRGYYKEQFCEIILNLCQWFRRRFIIWSSGGPPLRWSRTVYAILNKGIMGNIHV